MYGHLVFVGNLGGDPAMRYTPNGVPVTNFSVAVNRRWTNSDGTPGEEVTWYRVTAWRRLAEVCNEYLAKGRQVLVEGRLIPDPETGGPRVWTGKDGQARASFEVTASQVRFLGSGNGNSAQAPDEGADSGVDDEIPF